MEGEAYLRRLIDDALPELAGRRRDEGTRIAATMRLREIEAAGLALVAAGALTEQRRRELSGQLEELLVDRGLVERVWAEASGESHVEALSPVADRRERRLSLLDESAAPRPNRIVPILREAPLTSDDARLDVLSLEIWTDHFSVRYVMQGDSQTIEDFIGCAWEVWDGAGTPYRPTSGGTRGLEDWSDGTQDFAPAPPDVATTLTFTARNIPRGTELTRFSVALS